MKCLAFCLTLLATISAIGQSPQLPFNPDENGDGLIGVADLQSFLALYNTEFMAAVTSNDIAFINLGSMNRISCLTSCNNLPGGWGVASLREVSMNWSIVADVVGDWDPTIGGWQNDSEYFWISSRNTDYPVIEDPNCARFNQESDDEWYLYRSDCNTAVEDGVQCICSITQRPKIEYQRIVQDGSGPTMNANVNELLSAGWYIHSADELYIHLWRWKD